MYKRYIAQLNDICAQVIADFDYWNGQQSAIDRRLNELGARGDINGTVNEIEALIQQRKVAKDTALKLLPLRDFFKNGWDEACERIERAESWDRN